MNNALIIVLGVFILIPIAVVILRISGARRSVRQLIVGGCRFGDVVFTNPTANQLLDTLTRLEILTDKDIGLVMRMIEVINNKDRKSVDEIEELLTSVVPDIYVSGPFWPGGETYPTTTIGVVPPIFVGQRTNSVVITRHYPEKGGQVTVILGGRSTPSFNESGISATIHWYAASACYSWQEFRDQAARIGINLPVDPAKLPKFELPVFSDVLSIPLNESVEVGGRLVTR